MRAWVALGALLWPLLWACSDDSTSTTSSSSTGGSAGSTTTTGGGGAGATGGSPSCEAVSARLVSEMPGASSAARVAWNGTGWGIAWSDDRDNTNTPGDTELYFASLDAAGEKLGDDVRVTSESGFTTVGALVWNGSDYAVVFNDGRPEAGLYFTRLDASGQKLFDEVLITQGQVPRLTWNGTEYGLSFTVMGIVNFARLDENGVMLGRPTIIGNGYNPSPAVSSTGWSLTYHFGSTEFSIYFARLDASGALMGEPVEVAGASGWHSSLAARGDGFGVAWNSGFAMGMSVPGDIQFARLDAAGTVIGNVAPVTMGPAGYWFPSLAASDAGWGLGWVDDTDLEIAHIDDTGAAAAPMPLSPTAVESFFHMHVASNGSGYGIVWPDSRDGTDETYFAAVCP